MEWTFDDERPIYTQLVEQVELALVSGRWPPGAKLPGVRELAAEAGVNPNTMQRALAALEQSGLVYTQRTAGRFVTEDAERIKQLRGQLAAGRAGRFVRDMLALGCAPGEIDELVHRAHKQASGAPAQNEQTLRREPHE